ncbi:cytochrome P450 [Aspergillus avenaceus]|uniref:Cytochrome P450 n=1 Tax=Aspergillus avenaceus TaxID=36643 RepID=A0A5N6U0A9_ASPAV|nr:cytochrome P450 [Aspergillus avenaceus]
MIPEAAHTQFNLIHQLPLHGIISIITIFLVVRYLIQPLYFGPLSHVPGPWINKVSSLYLGYHDLTLDRNERIPEWHRKYGAVICISPTAVSVASTEAVREIYSSSGRYSKSSYFDHFTAYNQRSIFATHSYEEHFDKRRLTYSFYQASTVYKQPEVQNCIRERVLEVLARIEKSSDIEVDIYAMSDWYAFDVITHLAFGPGNGTQAVETDCKERQILRGLKGLQPWDPFHRTRSWQPGAIDGPPAVSGSLSLNYITAEILDNINATEATISVTATYLVYLLSLHPKWQEQLRKELQKLPVRPDGLPPFAGLDKAPIMEACLKEIYRLHPASSGGAERVVPDGGRTLSGLYVPAGTIVTTSVTAMHRDGRIFPSPEAFKPERWLENQSNDLDSHLVPFGYGARICLGKPLATMMIKLLIAGIYLRYGTRPAPSCTPASMYQCSTHDAVPRALQCEIQFHRVY